MIVGKKCQCHHNSGVLTAKYVFREVLIDLVGIIIVIAELRSILVIADDVFDIGNVPFDRSPEAVSHRAGALVSILLT